MWTPISSASHLEPTVRAAAEEGAASPSFSEVGVVELGVGAVRVDVD
jgi:hypothetical protein